jgi:HlyD family secretion protein
MLPLSRLRRAQWVLVVVLLVALAAVLAFLRPTLPGVGQADRRVAVARRGTVEATVRTTGHVQSARVLAVSSPVSAPVTLVAVSPGDRVERGDILVELDATGAERDLAHARTNLDAAELRLTAAQVNVRRNGTGPTELTSLYAADQAVQAARDALAAAEEMRRATLIVSPIAATVLTVNVRERQSYGAGSEAIVLNDLANLQITAEIDDGDLATVLRSREVRVTLDAYPERELPARLGAIAPTAVQRQGSTIYPATVEFDRPADLDVRPGMAANVAIVAASQPDALVIPTAAVRRMGERHVVQIVRTAGTEQVEVKLGVEGDGQVEVVAGLAEGDVVVLP